MDHWTKRLPLDQALERWLKEANNLLTNGAKLADRVRSEGAGVDDLGKYGALALLMYKRITERQIDAELRVLVESQSPGEAT